MAYAQTVMFAIQAGLRLYGASRKAYADSIRGYALILPLPRAPGVKVDTAENWFLTSELGIRILQRTPRIRLLVELQGRSEAQKSELVDLYCFYRTETARCDEDTGDARGSLTTDEMHAMLEVRQWSDSQMGGMSTPLQTVTGALVNIAIDYFLHTPGAVTENHPEGRALKAFLEALEKTDFATVPPKEIAGNLMMAVLDAVSTYPELLGGGKNEQVLIAGVTQALATSARDFLKDATDAELRDAGLWLRRIAHAVLKSAAETVLAEPGRYLNVQPGAPANVVVEVGRTMMGLLIGPDQINLDGLFSTEGLNKVVQSAMAAVARNPAILRIDNKGVGNIIVALAGQLSDAEVVFSPEVLPELVRLVLDKSAENLNLLWPAAQTSPETHLLIKATGLLLKALSTKPPGTTAWTFHLTPDQLIDVTDAILDEVIDNPAWLLTAAGSVHEYLHTAVAAILSSLSKVPRDRVSTETMIDILRNGIGVAALELRFLDELPAVAHQQADVAIGAVLDAVFSEIFDPDGNPTARWYLARNSSIVMIVEICLDALTLHGVSPAAIDIAGRAVRELVDAEGAFSPEAFRSHLEHLLSDAV